MAEQDCNKHTLPVYVHLNTGKLNFKEHPNLIAGLLRTLADYTDGYCASKHAYDHLITQAYGMTFYFSHADKQAAFKTRIRVYIERDIFQALTIQ